jgi:hypothetical protein
MAAWVDAFKNGCFRGPADQIYMKNFCPDDFFVGRIFYP